MKRKGFTLVELMLVVVIIATLSGIVLVAYSGYTQKAKKTATKQQIKIFDQALEMFEMHVGRYPTSDEGLRALRIKPDNVSGWDGPYLREAIPKDTWQSPYRYEAPGKNNPKHYDLWSIGEDLKDGSEDDIANWSSDESIE